MAIVFQRLSPTFGHRTIAAILENSLARRAKRHKILRHLAVTEDGVQWDAFRNHLHEASDQEISAALEQLLDEFFDVISHLIGRLIATKLAEEAKETAKRGDKR